MVSRTYIWMLGIAAVLVSATGGYFSVYGIMQLFSGAGVSTAVMAGSLEFSKFVVVGFLYRYWGHVHKPLKIYLCFSVVILMVITSVGIFGYLSNAYQISSVGVKSDLMAIDSLERENVRIVAQINEFRRFIDEIPSSRISRKFEFQREYEPKILELRKQSDGVLKQIDDRKRAFLSTQSKIGPVVYLAKSLGMDIDDVVKWLILIFVSVFDPLAVSLVFCLNLLLRLREKYRGNEYKIGAHSLTSPVDHRFDRYVRRSRAKARLRLVRKRRRAA
ncbi:MAG TPA: hypothetical protein VM598_05280 [Bdellovibrionota bacterium]|nr:hypothetical protein [Bdellovibrionota bacterium]